tara:strand:- start:5911 stop:7161 length:1251 start_codon:yes stop_codon:yes gene_type:complete
MAQVNVGNYPVPNSTGANVRADINENLADIFTTSSGSTPPPAAGSATGQLWIDTSTNPDTLKVKTGSGTTSSNYTTLGNIATNFGHASSASPTFTGNIGFPAGSNSSLPIRNAADTDTGIYWGATNELDIRAGNTDAHTFTSSASEPKLPLRGTNGSNSAPSISFSSDTDLGLYRSAANTLSVTTGGTERLFVNSTGLTIKAQGDLRLSDSSSSNWAAIQAPSNIGTNYTLTLPTTDGNSDQILKSDGSGNLSWTTVSSLQNATTGGFTAYAVLYYAVNSGTHGGSSSTSWATRPLNTEHADPSSIVSISSNQFTLAAGNYLIRASACSYDCQSVRLRIYDVTNSTSRIVGANGYGETYASENTWNSVVGRVTPSGTTAYKLQQITDQARGTWGHGFAQSLGGDEIYVMIEIFKER